MDEQQHGDRIKLNVGGKLFETTSSTLQSDGPDSLLAILSSSPETESGSEIFIDRDPEIFSVILSLLRSNRLPSTTRKFSNKELVDEALYYDVESYLRAAMAPPLLSGIDTSPVRTIQPAADTFGTCFSTGSDDGSVWIAYGGQISAYNWNLSHIATVRTHLNEITSLQQAWPKVAVVDSTEAPGLHFYHGAWCVATGSRCL